MKKIFYPLKVLWAFWFLLIFAFVFLLFYPLFYLWLRNEKDYAKANNLRRLWAKTFFIFTGLFYKVRHEEKLDKNRVYVFCPNHFSYLDIPLFGPCFKGNFRFMAKMELGNIPLFNIFFRTVDISVNRGSITESTKAFHKAAESIDKKMSLVIFPEGRIGDHPPKLERFKNGAFRLAIEKQVPVVPVTFIDNWKLLYVGSSLWGRPGVARIVVHKPVSTQGMTMNDLEALKNKVHDIINQTLKEYEGR